MSEFDKDDMIDSLTEQLAAVKWAFGDRSNECLRECMHSPIFILQRRRAVVWDCPFGWDIDADGDIFMTEDNDKWSEDMAEDDQWVSGSDAVDFLVDNECAQVYWDGELAFGTRLEAEEYLNRRSYNYPEGARIYSINLEGSLREAVRALFK